MIHNQTIRRQKRVRAKLAKNIGIPRLSIFRSNSHIWAQIIDDKHGKTIVSANTKTIKATGTRTEKAVALGLALAKLALEKKVINVRFDRGQYKYHGRVKALADAARQGGLKF